ncbi:universal stress protein [uncultured Algibacter sp.]|uniref:universal stress protein n=1 Tax=uncultured Algibacter sp. TaxID=298659 RepID=UPI0026216F27|nr:universal stress protein [uncultured Algibacter sp.]
MKTNKYKILVLSDNNNATSTTLENTISLAKMIDGEIMLFGVKDPLKVVKETNQLSAMREINHQFTFTNNSLKRLAKSASEKFGVNINSTFVIGRVNDEISTYIKDYQPDVIVVKRRKQRILNLVGDTLTDFVLNTFSGPILVTDEESTFKHDKSLTLGVLNGIDKTSSRSIFGDLLPHTNNPIKMFKIIDSKNSEEDNTQSDIKDAVEFVFEQNDSSVKNLSKYLEKNGINLLYLNRGNFKSKKRRKLNSYISKLKVPMLLSAQQAI